MLTMAYKDQFPYWRLIDVTQLVDKITVNQQSKTETSK